MTDNITLRGFVATEVRTTTADSGLAIAGFRMCTTERRFDREAGLWQDGHTNWYSVSMFRQLATNAGVSIHKGDRVIVTGRLRLRQWATDAGRSGTTVDIDADSVGHDLMWGTANFRRNSAERAPLHGVGDGSVAAESAEGSDGAFEGDVDPSTGELLSAENGFTGSPVAGLSEELDEARTVEPEPAAY
ncbi:single-stranded DNA-binding protein [Arthrobacter gandavensis]|uniref:single-stranded DNA-binding protein n=1 Tax=Arthrobacter gandavensis TaxID=169960 RepID=UPI00188EC316|nr:single-stranded DNA-binding protein [Arthrobacter gandavensis]MBF4995436.1 single-stranded DNA-binding protein [Arthrobacter gandavensis]